DKNPKKLRPIPRFTQCPTRLLASTSSKPCLSITSALSDEPAQASKSRCHGSANTHCDTKPKLPRASLALLRSWEFCQQKLGPNRIVSFAYAVVLQINRATKNANCFRLEPSL